MMRREFGLVLELLDDARDLVDVAAVGRRPRAPLHAVHRPEVAVGAAHSSQIVTSRSCSQRALPSPRRNQSSSRMIERRCTFLVVTSGKPSRRSKRIWWPNTLFVPVPVRSALVTPWSRTWRMKSSYWERMGRVGSSANRFVDADRSLATIGLAKPGSGARRRATSAVRLACCGLTPLRCSVAWPAAELATFAAFTALKQAAASQTTKRVLRARGPAPCAARRLPRTPAATRPRLPAAVCACGVDVLEAVVGCLPGACRRRAAQASGPRGAAAPRGLTCRSCPDGRAPACQPTVTAAVSDRTATPPAAHTARPRATSCACVPVSTISPASMHDDPVGRCTVARRWAMTRVVRSRIADSSAAWTMRSPSASSALVASSSSSSGGFFRIARAIEMRCRCPPERRTPRSPRKVL